ncbi:energy transducer TonB [Luteirhabdus pelagi]|jgi:protein TonB|uniref:energy transducer TonB n=1 Tax=Luteirhabdus pelagi TaxID=2792783 RepID=UPI001939645A|nr:energy transducer TonB [Luteirhabdus pelagi]
MKNLEQHEKKLNKRMLKQGVSRKWNSAIFFQVGLIIGLLTVFVVLESTLDASPKKIAKEDEFFLPEVTIHRYTLEKIKSEVPIKKTQPKKQVEPKQPEPTSKPPVAARNDADIKETEISTTELTPETPSEQPAATTEPSKSYNTISVEQAPIFPGCERQETKQEQIDCFSEKISRFVQRKFNTNKFSGRYESGSVQQIFVQFTVATSGEATDIKVRAVDSALEAEAKRVVSQLPNIIPGKMGSTAVPVTYAFPIQFMME